MKDVLTYVLIKLTYVHVWIIIFAVIVTIAMIYFMIRPPKEDSDSVESVVTTKGLLKEVNEEREKQGLHSVPEVNSASGASTGTLARRDKSFKSVPDFFIKLFSKKKE